MSINYNLSGMKASLVKGRGTALAVEGFIIQQQESPRHFVALSPLTRGALFPLQTPIHLKKTGRVFLPAPLFLFSQFFQYIGHWLIEVNLHCIAFASFTKFCWDKFCRFVIHLFNPDTIFIDLTLDVTVC